jgi:AraC-like DNA-binding protein
MFFAFVLTCAIFLSYNSGMNYIEHIEIYDNISRFTEHNHMSNEIIYVIDGEVIITSGGSDYIISKGEICLIPSGVSHSTHKNNKAYKRWLIFLNPWSFGKKYFSVELQGLLLGVIIKQPLIINFSNSFEDINKTFQEIYDEITNPKLFSEDIVMSRMLNFLFQSARKYITKEQALISESFVTIMKIQIYLQENSHLPIKICDVADKFYTNKFYLTHTFKDYTGKSPKQFLMDCRLEKAYQLLSNSSINITEISEQCGFVSPSDMTKRFREKYGVVPTMYRKQNINKVII